MDKVIKFPKNDIDEFGVSRLEKFKAYLKTKKQRKLELSKIRPKFKLNEVSEILHLDPHQLYRPGVGAVITVGSDRLSTYQVKEVLNDGFTVRVEKVNQA